MAKMAELHAMLSEYDEPICEWCGDSYTDCQNAGECPGPLTR